MKKLCFTLSVLMLLCLCGCGEATPQNAEKPKEPLNLSGEWVLENSEKEEMYHKAIITEDTIEIYWVIPAEKTEMLYWAGSYTAPTESTKTYSWTSINDTEKTSMALLASTDESKEFHYKNNKIEYQASAMGVTKTMCLEKVSE